MTTDRKRYMDMIREVGDQVEEVFPWDLMDELAGDPRVLLLDIRCPHEYQNAHIEGSINVPRGILELACDYGYEETVPELVEAREGRVVAICRSGNRSILATHTLQLMGFSNVASLRTGLRGWNDYEQPLRDAAGRVLSLDEADEYFTSNVTPEKLGPSVPATARAQRAAAGAG